jgi:hypothetical protein
MIMIWVLIVGSSWVVLAFGMAVLIGRGIRLAETAAAGELTDEIDQFLREAGGQWSRRRPEPTVEVTGT